MSSNYHTPIENNAVGKLTDTYNDPMGDIDAQIGVLNNGLYTEGGMRAPLFESGTNGNGQVSFPNFSAISFRIGMGNVSSGFSVLTAGKYWFAFAIVFEPNSTGYRRAVYRYFDPASTQIDVRVPAVSGDVTVVSYSGVVDAPVGYQFYVGVLQDSGVSLQVKFGSFIACHRIG